MLLSSLTPSPTNPRHIRKEQLDKLVAMIRDFPGMLALRPIIYDGANNNEILGGNQRYAALRIIGYTEIPDEWCKDARSLTEQEKKKFILLDNRDMGEDDYDLLSSWDPEHLQLADITIPDGISNEIQIDRFEVKYNIIVECASEAEQATLLEKFEKEGHTCRPIML